MNTRSAAGQSQAGTAGASERLETIVQQAVPPGEKTRETFSSNGSKLLVGLARGFGGALIFALPMLMTMEMWWLGFYLERFRLVLLLVVNIPLLTFLSHLAGFEETFEWRDDLRDAFIAYGIGFSASALILAVFGVVTTAMPSSEIVGKIAVQSVPASIGALLGRSQFGGRKADPQQEAYAGELFLMGIGALFLGLNVAPTEEMILISYKMTEWHAIALIALSILLMHGFVYALEFKGGSSLSPETPWWSAFLRYTLVGYVIAILVSLYVLWTFGRTEGASATQVLMSVMVLGFPSSIGAAAARLIL